MDGREIPGFYFDPEKRKYFKILPGNLAPEGAKYSRENVEKEQDRAKNEKKEHKRQQKRKQQTIVASHHGNALFQAYHDRAIGHRRPSYYQKNAWPSAHASRLEGQRVVQSGIVRFFAGETLSERVYTVRGDVPIHSARRPSVDGLIYINGMVEFIAGETDLGARSGDIARMTSPISSLNSLPLSKGLVTTTYGADRPPVVYLTDPERDGPYVGEQFTPRDCSTIWCSSPKPTFLISNTNSIPATGTEQVAVGANSNLLLFSRTPYASWDCETVLKGQSDILALDWLSSDAIACGHRNGQIKIYDTRAKSAAIVMRHPAPTTSICRGDDFTRLVCAGLSNTLSMYDLRMAASSAAQNPPRKKRTNHGAKSRNSRFPYADFTPCITRFAHKNRDIQDLGMDVSPKLGLVAAADENNKLNVYNMYNGRLVKTFQGDYGEESRYKPVSGPRIRCVRWVDEELWATVDGDVVRYSWDA